MSGTTTALIAAAAGVGLGHAVMPDHWLPLAVLGRARGYPLARVARLSGLAGVAHVLVSLLMGAVIVGIGLQFRSSIEHAQDTIVGSVLLATGIAFLAFELTGRRTHHHPHHPSAGHEHHHTHQPSAEHEHHQPLLRPGERKHKRTRGLAAIMVPFGAAASPDLTILPVFLAAAGVGTGTAIGSLVAFAAITILTIVGLTLLATYGGYRIRGGWLERWGNAITAGVLLTIGALVLSGTM